MVVKRRVGYAPSPRQQQQRRRRRREEPIPPPPPPLAETKYRVNITLSYRRPALQCIAHLVEKEAGSQNLPELFATAGRTYSTSFGSTDSCRRGRFIATQIEVSDRVQPI
ncbi:hypothetical protein GHT06_017966 [Daphnia sinensis]|uniref:Uncharacterized protein n=1 Tax=Daphnia sinensis TaxID=1820382 RepID=A0AAD5PPR1_9CRUS|nr:hypothetical protein GHT06_017966 [Daphnia sinensis]